VRRNGNVGEVTYVAPSYQRIQVGVINWRDGREVAVVISATEQTEEGEEVNTRFGEFA